MEEPQLPGVQHLPLCPCPTTVGSVSEQAMAQVGEVNPDLMRSAGVQSALHHRDPLSTKVQFPQNPPVRPGFAPLTRR
ncbi:MAG: hypothetical protein RLZZ399_33 [Verrucomicrobiota bacterium]